MAKGRDFEQILKEKMGVTPFSPPVSDPKSSLNSFLSEAKTVFINPFELQWQRKIKSEKPLTQAYPIKRKPVVVKTPISEAKPILKKSSITLSFELLTPLGQKALRDLISLGAQIPESSFTLSLLKKEYRRLLKSRHPDLNPQKFEHDSFATLQKSFRVLEQVFNSKPEQS